MPQTKNIIERKKNPSWLPWFYRFIETICIHIPRNGLCFFNEDYHVDFTLSQRLVIYEAVFYFNLFFVSWN